MANYREILRLSSLGFNHTQIAKSADCSRTTVINVLQLAKEKELKYPLPKGMSDKALYEALFPSAAGKPKYKMHIAVFPGQQGHNSRPVRAVIGGQQAA